MPDRLPRGLVKAAVVAVLALTAWDEMTHVRRRAALRFSSWWERIDHQQRSYLHEVELAHLFRRMEPH